MEVFVGCDWCSVVSDPPALVKLHRQVDVLDNHLQ